MVTYCFANMDTVYLLDENLKIIESGSVSQTDVEAISKGKISDAESKIIAHKTDIVFCNYKHDESHNLIDYSILKKIITACKSKLPRQEQFVAITAKKISNSVTWDTLLCQAIRSTDEFDKALNMLAKRLREWYEWHNPEFSRSVESHERFAELILSSDRNTLLKEINVDPKDSMGAELTEKDLAPILVLANQVMQLKALRETTTIYIHEQMKIHLPNFTAIAGAQVGAKLLGTTGTVTRLVKMTSSTIQVLGAEKALFRHLKTGARPPKHGLLFQHPLVSKAKPTSRGKIARMIANALSLAVRTDYFSPDNRTFGVDKIKEIEVKIQTL